MSRLVTIARFHTPHEAAISKGRLEAEGIESWLRDELITQLYHFTFNAIGGIRLQVKEADAEQARRILIETGAINPEDGTPTKLQLYLEEWLSKSGRLNREKIPHYLLLSLGVFGLAALIWILFFGPTLEDKLANTRWCVAYLQQDSLYWEPETIEETPTFKIILYGDCYEEMNIWENGQIQLPGLSSPSVMGRWRVENNRFIISHTDSLASFYEHSFRVKRSGRELRFVSPEITIYAYRPQPLGLW